MLVVSHFSGQHFRRCHILQISETSTGQSSVTLSVRHHQVVTGLIIPGMNAKCGNVESKHILGTLILRQQN